ncbi:MAG: hypothetical protein Q7S36_03585 [Candidatus Liptonbacteria bacterium]|nr:hypothetical protein [Candidatus Liptonbacteria bacterium]
MGAVNLKENEMTLCETRLEKLNKLKNLVEDSANGTEFDIAVLAAISKLALKFGSTPVEGLSDGCQPKPGSAYNLPELAKKRMGLRRRP